MTTTTSPPLSRLLRPNEVCAMLNISKRTLARYVGDAIKHVHGHPRYERRKLLRMIRRWTVMRRGFRHYEALPDRLLTLSEASDYAGINQRTLLRARSDGKLAWIQIGPGTPRVDRREIDSFIDREDRKRRRR